jgi:uncharacterized protein YkwD
VIAATAAAAPSAHARAAAVPGSPEWAAQLLAEVNGFRAQNGLPPLVESPVVDRLAVQHTSDMVARGYFDHTDPDGVSFQQRVDSVFAKEGYGNRTGIENIAYDNGSVEPDAIFQIWLASAMHRANMLAKDVPSVGVGSAFAGTSSGVYGGGPVTVATLIAGPPQPVLGASVVAAVDAGTVLVKLPGTNKFVPLTSTQPLPVGSELDTTRGKVRVTSVADQAGDVQSADFYQGRFVVSYVTDPTNPTSPNVTQLRLSGPPPVCTAKKTSKRRLAAKPPTKKKAKKQVTERHLWGSGTGTFRTQGKYAAATVRGTVWLTRDDCTGTLVRVTQGLVDVNDLVLHKHVLVTAGHSYLARKKR